MGIVDATPPPAAFVTYDTTGYFAPFPGFGCVAHCTACESRPSLPEIRRRWRAFLERILPATVCATRKVAARYAESSAVVRLLPCLGARPKPALPTTRAHRRAVRELLA